MKTPYTLTGDDTFDNFVSENQQKETHRNDSEVGSKSSNLFE